MAPNPKPTGHCYFLDLPPETRNAIYELLQDEHLHHSITICQSQEPSDVPFPITRISWQIRAECLKMFYSTLSVRFKSLLVRIWTLARPGCRQ